MKGKYPSSGNSGKRPRISKPDNRNSEKGGFGRSEGRPSFDKPRFPQRSEARSFDKPRFGDDRNSSDKPRFSEKRKDEGGFKPKSDWTPRPNSRPAFPSKNREEKGRYEGKPEFSRKPDFDKPDSYKSFRTDRSEKRFDAGFERKKPENFFQKDRSPRDRNNDSRFPDKKGGAGGGNPRFGKDRKEGDFKNRERSPKSYSSFKAGQSDRNAEKQEGMKDSKSFLGRKTGGERPEIGWEPNRQPKKHHPKQIDANDGLIRLNRYIANAGICSRREADELISQGLISVNGKIITELGYKVEATDQVKYDGRLLKREKPIYVLLNKPKDFITTTDDPEDRKTVMSLVAGAGSERLFPVGRLDRNTTGLLLLTNDGELSEKLTHPSYKIHKIYQVDLDKPLTTADLEKITKGVMLEDGVATVDEIEVLSAQKDIVGISIHIGRNRIVRRLFEHLGYKVVRLDRVMYAGLTKKDLPRGNWRYLTEKEIINLKYLNS